MDIRSDAIRSVLLRGYFVAIGFVTTVVFARLVSVDEFGRYSLLLSIALLVSGIAQAGTTPLIVRESATHSELGQVRSLVRFSLKLIINLLLVLISCGVIVAAIVGNDWRGVLVAGCAALGLVVMAVLSAAVRGLGKVIVGQMPDLLVRPSSLLAVVLISVFLGLKLDGLRLLALHVAAITVALIYIFSEFRKLTTNTGAVENSSEQKRQWLQKILTIASVGWIGIGITQTSPIFLGVVGEEADVALLRVGVQFAALATLGLSAAESAYSPRFSATYAAGQRADLARMVSQSCRISSAIALVFVVALIPSAETLIDILFDPEYRSAVEVVRVLLFAQLINAVFGAVGTLLIACNREREVVFANAASFTVLIGGLLTLTSTFGVLGAAFAIALALTVRNGWCAVIVVRKLGVLPLPYGKIGFNSGGSTR